MRTMRMMVIVLAGALALAGCGRKNLPVPPTPEGQEPRPAAIEPQDPALGRVTGITGGRTDVSPAEITTNPRAEPRPFILDGLLN
jgi:predicted small lipoprotein YifL